MYLKSIEIQGFKSFANKILFEFHNGITGIVGPNGSGKSNVADAVRWVLGEQRAKQLRGGSMQDVIFAGTELRKPQGFAYVAITLDNSDHQLAIDYDEVTVSRRLYRSGESEYKINGSTCRLKDISELFYDTGIGKEGYSIIGQGQIDKILSGKPEERRELFDEAAGIVKFKRRKAIAQKKLEDEKQNLIRVSDILSELEKQVGPLARQSETAKKYLALREELKTCDVNLFLMESEENGKQLQEISKRESIVSGDLQDANAESEHLKEAYETLEREVAELDDQLTEKRNQMNQAEMLKGNLEGQINVLKEQINTVNKEKEKALSEVKMAAAEKDRISKYITSLKDDYESKLDGYEDILKDKEELNDALREKNSQLNSKLEAMSGDKKALNALQSEFSDLTAKYDAAIKDKESAESALAKACADHKKAESDHAKELEHCKSELQLAHEKAILELEQKYQATIQKLKEEKQAEIDKYQQKYFDLLEKTSSKK